MGSKGGGGGEGGGALVNGEGVGNRGGRSVILGSSESANFLRDSIILLSPKREITIP